MNANKPHIKPNVPGPRPVKEIAYPSEKRAEIVCIETKRALKSFFPSYDFDPDNYVQQIGRILRVSANIPIIN